MRLSRALLAAVVAPLALGLAACGGGSDTATTAGSSPSSAGSKAAAGGTAADTLRLGYFANVTHAAALAAVGKGFLAKDLGSTTLKTAVFNAGPAAIEALNGGAIDAAYLGPSPAINAYIKSHGEALRIVGGAASGGAQLVVNGDKIKSIADLKGKNLATPQLGGTQDVALRAFLTGKGLKNSVSGGGDVTITPTENAQTLQLFQDGKIDGAWLPEPWASRLVLDAGAKVLLDEKDLWPGGKWVTTNIVVTTKFLQQHPQTVTALLKANLEAVDWINADKAAAKTVVNQQIEKDSGKALSTAVIDRAFQNLEITADPLASTAEQQLKNGVAAGTTNDGSIDGIYDLTLLNKILKDAGKPPVSAAGLGKE